MADLLDRHDPYVEPEWTNGYERLLVSIINQSISTASARAVRERVFALFDGEVTPEAVLNATESELVEAGLGERKTEYARHAAEAYLERDLTPAGLADHSDEEVIDELTEIRGIGAWTARMYLLFVLERDDVLPLGDLAVRRGIETLYNDGEEMSREEMRSLAKRWRPYRSHAVRYIWAEYESDE
ncbi:DNA-3-methyladenine glycosylase family protein [Halomarina ordinaria]|uniref:DNA-3-methyladenine glycosylase family protein n=1 Tax=Halomarina ordinaria TaxID=3033939 RepID=A0ABD5U471_9EURY|nr:DNA-3-methyladenine glycosylase 2 family protein [Halomarina sp. PSRA2]